MTKVGCNDRRTRKIRKEEEPVQMKPQEGSLHRQAEDEKEEEPVQARLDEKLTHPHFGE